MRRDVEYGCTAIVAVYTAGNLVIGNAGDSRAFLLRKQYVQPANSDIMCQQRLTYVAHAERM
jgi:serine/threonine protein phosphatase PrpC